MKNFYGEELCEEHDVGKQNGEWYEKPIFYLISVMRTLSGLEAEHLSEDQSPVSLTTSNFMPYVRVALTILISKS